MKNEEISFIEVEEVLKKNKVRTRTIFTRKSRKLSDVLDDLAKKWHKISKEDRKLLMDILWVVFLVMLLRRNMI